MAQSNTFEGYPIIGWAIDDWEAFYQASTYYFFSDNKDVSEYINRYEENSFRDNVLPLFQSASLPLNLGGTTEKTKLIQTSNPQGIFDFSLAARGLYKVPEYYSDELAQKFPNKFEKFGTIAGIVPPNLVQRDMFGFYYQDTDGKFACVLKQKGQIEKDLGIAGAKLKFATRTKKSYLQYRKNRGKVKYVEIYSLFYYTSLSGDVQYAIRHIPALMAAEYLESIGIKVRFYMTRFVLLEANGNVKIRKNWLESKKVVLPLYEESPNKESQEFLYVQPIIAKDFGEDTNYPLFFCIGSSNYSQIYKSISHYVFDNEVMKQLPIGGQPDWQQPQYREGFERFKNKYLIYNKKGIFKSKELLPDAMFFFHDMVIKEELEQFVYNVENSLLDAKTTNLIETTFVTTHVVSSPFFNWWMRMSATTMKNKVVLVNSNELVKDIKLMEVEINQLFTDYQVIIDAVPDPVKKGVETDYQHSSTGTSLKKYLKDFGKQIMQKNDETNSQFGYSLINKKGQVDIKVYISNMIDEITVTAEGKYFATSDEDIEKRKLLADSVFEALTRL